MPTAFASRTISSTLLCASLAFAGCHTGPQNGVAATVNGHAIQTTEVDKIYNGQFNGSQAPQPSADQANAQKLQVLRELIDTEIIQQRAAKMNLVATPEEVDAKLAQMKAPFTEEEFNARLKASNHTLDDVKHDLRRSLTIDKLLAKEIDSKITVTDADVTSYYNAHKAEYNLIENQFHLAQIQVTGAPAQQAGNLQGSKAASPEEAMAKIKALKNRLDSGEDFGAIAMNFSERPDTAPNGGDMGFVQESAMKSDAAVYAAVMKLKPGQTSDIVPTIDPQTHKPVAFSIYKLISKEPAGQREINDVSVQQSIRQQLRDSRSQLLKSAYFEMLRDQARVENFFAEQVFKDAAK